jgi:lysophospholipid acyltransferase (LPLAT)-like uncharacterized protein
MIPGLAVALIRGLHATMRIRHAGTEDVESLEGEGRRFILAFWHAHLLMMVYARYPRPIAAMISRHRDGDLIARTVAKFGAGAARGSTSRGGTTALREMIRMARDHTLAITPDGPRGPRHVAQPGVIQIAQATGLPIIPVAFVAQKKKFSARGTDLKFRSRSRERSSSTASGSTCRAGCRNPRWSSIGGVSNELSTRSESAVKRTSSGCGSRG